MEGMFAAIAQEATLRARKHADDSRMWRARHEEAQLELKKVKSMLEDATRINQRVVDPHDMTMFMYYVQDEFPDLWEQLLDVYDNAWRDRK